MGNFGQELWSEALYISNNYQSYETEFPVEYKLGESHPSIIAIHQAIVPSLSISVITGHEM